MADPGPPTPRNTRGKAKLEWLKHIKPGTKVSYEHIDGVPVGSNASKLSTFAGKLAKDGHYFPFDTRSWPHISELATKIETAKEQMKNIFHWCEESDYWLCKTLSETWRENKHRKKVKFFNPYTTIEEWYAKCPTSVIPTLWENMVDYCQTTGFKESRIRNTGNQEQLTDHHTTGSKSFLRHAKEDILSSLSAQH